MARRVWRQWSRVAAGSWTYCGVPDVMAVERRCAAFVHADAITSNAGSG
jgi:hypothetical protein